MWSRLNVRRQPSEIGNIIMIKTIKMPYVGCSLVDRFETLQEFGIAIFSPRLIVCAPCAGTNRPISQMLPLE